MKAKKKLPLMFAAIAAVLLIAGTAVSCASTGNFMPLSPGDTVIGTIQTSFAAYNTLNGRNALNTQAYIKLLESARGEYGQDVQIDIRDIVWVSGKKADGVNTEYSATGKVVRIY
jgi:hypothetical protein